MPMVDQFGLRKPPPVPSSSSGDTKFDAAIETLRKRCASLAKKGEWGPPKLPARLAKPKPGDTELVIAMLPPEAFDPGDTVYDLGFSGDKKAYLAAWRETIAEVGPRNGLVAALIALALRDEAGEAHVRPHLPTAMVDNAFAREINEAMLACERTLDPDTLKLGLLVFESERDTPANMYAGWESATKIALALGPELAGPTLTEYLSTNRSKAILETLERQRSIDPAWRDLLVGAVKNGQSVSLLLTLPPDAEILSLIRDALASYPVPVPRWSAYLEKHGG